MGEDTDLIANITKTLKKHFKGQAFKQTVL
jgi:hypothetical protein